MCHSHQQPTIVIQGILKLPENWRHLVHVVPFFSIGLERWAIMITIASIGSRSVLQTKCRYNTVAFESSTVIASKVVQVRCSRRIALFPGDQIVVDRGVGAAVSSIPGFAGWIYQQAQ